MTTFTLSPPVTNINALRVIGPNGGNAGSDANGFLGVFELTIEATVVGDIDGGLAFRGSGERVGPGVQQTLQDPDRGLVFVLRPGVSRKNGSVVQCRQPIFIAGIYPGTPGQQECQEALVPVYRRSHQWSSTPCALPIYRGPVSQE